ncbi:P-loop containing nucleoside triphosphate hydrolase protein [Lophiostoma macrostomum CBS 122681]|uniref:P-loop containing nucleoside triphosphate hydrolase protein n=1 Tax=Lophiostoma macrostomum CBS 122681 TaxID=1314788 RepID=A0A6A6T979_9PLEO|nr:P-loop containing nucleoside triphosphate hydrolase protein [Lophiostoma macrostomum CBS 122681]
MDLPIYPIRFSAESAAIEHRLAARGRRFAELQGCHYKAYKGFAQIIVPNFGKRITHIPRQRSVSAEWKDASSSMQGSRFSVDQVQEISWDNRAFDSLVLPSGYKNLILSFTKNQNAAEDLLDDAIEGKGKGIVMLLTGEPGVGKTLTAESVAEHMRVPLYPMSAAQLGINSETVEQSLSDILEMVTKWKAILLLDETEVFLEQRSIDSLERNKLVSIFLRMFEYYRGVLFLTTNSVAALDKAIESRIHLKIVYPELDQPARLRRTMNGREIKTVIKAAQLLANGQETTMALDHVYTVLRITQISVDV